MVASNTEVFANSGILVAAMERWPSVHDANLKEVRRQGDTCLVAIHVFETTDEVDSKGYLVLTKHHLVMFQMSGIVECSLRPDYRSDCLCGLQAQRVGDLVRIVFESAIDPELTWHVFCRTAEVVSAVGCDHLGERAV